MVPIRSFEERWAYDRWGGRGRPVLFLNDPVVDRSVWWPVAARIADEHDVVVLDLPELGSPEALTDELGDFTAGLGTRAPILVGYGPASLVASLFALRFMAHAVVGVEQNLDPYRRTGSQGDPSPHGDRRARTAELNSWRDGPTVFRMQREISGGPKSVPCPLLSVFSAEPRPGYAAWLGQRFPTARCEIYGTPSPYPHLDVPDRFTADVLTMAA